MISFNTIFSISELKKVSLNPKINLMKKRTFITTITFVCILLFGANLQAQKFSGLDKSPMDAASYPSDYKNSSKLIKIVYSRPQLKGRSLAKLTPNGEVWRTGANEAAELTLYTDMNLGEKNDKSRNLYTGSNSR